MCLDPSPAVGLAAQRLHNTRHALNSPSLRSAARRHSQIAANRKRKLDQFTAKPVPHLADFIARRKTQPTRHTTRPHTAQQATTNMAPKHQKKVCIKCIISNEYSIKFNYISLQISELLSCKSVPRQFIVYFFHHLFIKFAKYFYRFFNLS